MRNGLVSYSLEDHIATITLENAPANAYSYEMMRDLDDAILEARFADDCHVIVLDSAGDKFFCAGADIEMLKSVTPEFKYNFCLHANETLQRLENTSKLVIAAICGHCVGGGFEVALAADIRVAASGTGRIGLPEVGLGVLPGTGGTQRLARLLGRSQALELMITGELMEFDDAQILGLVNQVFSETGDAFRARVRDYATSFCAPSRAPLAIGLIKRAVQSGTDLSLDAGLALERELQQRLFTSADSREGIAAFAERRKPAFEGK